MPLCSPCTVTAVHPGLCASYSWSECRIGRGDVETTGQRRTLSSPGAARCCSKPGLLPQTPGLCLLVPLPLNPRASSRGDSIAVPWGSGAGEASSGLPLTCGQSGGRALVRVHGPRGRMKTASPILSRWSWGLCRREPHRAGNKQTRSFRSLSGVQLTRGPGGEQGSWEMTQAWVLVLSSGSLPPWLLLGWQWDQGEGHGSAWLPPSPMQAGHLRLTAPGAQRVLGTFSVGPLPTTPHPTWEGVPGAEGPRLDCVSKPRTGWLHGQCTAGVCGMKSGWMDRGTCVPQPNFQVQQ